MSVCVCELLMSLMRYGHVAGCCRMPLHNFTSLRSVRAQPQLAAAAEAVVVVVGVPFRSSSGSRCIKETREVFRRSTELCHKFDVNTKETDPVNE